ncbi:MAG: hypothetical protein CL814_08525 [Confluentimicrobium sp.]|uniref:Sulfotransferase family protein n=1 Tax=Actibacterium naphthalenivorans TaxID=1614693 RepID=A0A840CD94_9RHOB|nr:MULTISPECIES: sulfotransferase family 2 domain-containing protein [Actibacterium]ALG88952.1 hypothetical protein TQ29_00735 [Actibacterium sp. EMB200-NS6]MBB4021508.1 hypothetical protein [Actibacterium naphthalenivorans]MBC56967.1 hypothetical protein [Actibacterium sp.]MDY6860307.1 sulfotransferase family 2 domain-containing protein [Pseudomonadota bacterium]
MPIIRADSKLIFFAHVPKCGGSAVQTYLNNRFGPLAFEDRRFLSVPERKRWSKTSPQHVDVETLNRMFPQGFFDHSFAIVRHPVARVVSAYHFQLEVENTISRNVSFSDWLINVAEQMEEQPFLYDNHLRPMNEMVPEGAKLFYLEHGLDALVPWFDEVTGGKAGPRAVPHTNKRGDFSKVKSVKVVPDDADLALIATIYAQDFERFAYEMGNPAPTAPAPLLAPEVIAERDAELSRVLPFHRRLVNRLSDNLRRQRM